MPLGSRESREEFTHVYINELPCGAPTGFRHGDNRFDKYPIALSVTHGEAAFVRHTALARLILVVYGIVFEAQTDYIRDDTASTPPGPCALPDEFIRIYDLRSSGMRVTWVYCEPLMAQHDQYEIVTLGAIPEDSERGTSIEAFARHYSSVTTGDLSSASSIPRLPAALIAHSVRSYLSTPDLLKWSG